MHFVAICKWIKLSEQEPKIGDRCVVLIDGEKESCPVCWTDRGFVYADGHELGWDCSHWRLGDGD